MVMKTDNAIIKVEHFNNIIHSSQRRFFFS